MSSREERREAIPSLEQALTASVNHALVNRIHDPLAAIAEQLLIQRQEQGLEPRLKISHVAHQTLEPMPPVLDAAVRGLLLGAVPRPLC